MEDKSVLEIAEMWIVSFLAKQIMITTAMDTKKPEKDSGEL